MRISSARLRLRTLLALSCFLPPFLLAKDWEKLERCKLESNRYSDGDSFFVSHKNDSYCFRLILCDTPETSNEFPERVKMQEKTFRVDEKHLFQIAKEATEFTEKALNKPFTVYTKWEDAAGVNKRFYAYVVTHDGKDLTKELIRNGYSTAFGKHEEYFDGTTGDTLFQEVKALEQKARKNKAGIWKFSGLSSQAVTDSPASIPKGTIPATDLDQIQKMLGKTVTVSGEVSRVGQTPNKSITFINFQGSDFTGVIFESNLEAVEKDLGSPVREALAGKTITLQGEISAYKDTPQIKITDSAQIEVQPTP